MEELWSSASYEPHLLSLPFAFAPAAMLIVIAYATAMRGAPALRGWLLAHCLALLPYAIVMTLSPSTKSPEAATHLFRFAAAFIPMAAAAGTGFQLSLLRRNRRYRFVLWAMVASAFVWIVVGSLTDAAVAGVHRLPTASPVWYARAGSWAWLALIHTCVLSIGGFVALAHRALRSKPSTERRQLRLALAANLITYAGLVDVGLAYDIGVFPVGWLLSGIGSLLVLRAILVEDLLRVRAVDTALPRLVAHFVAAMLLAWITLSQVGPTGTWWGITATLLMCFIGVRVSVAILGLVSRGARRGNEGPLDRLVAQLVARTRTMTSDPEIAKLATDIIELGIGVRPTILLASEDDWGWTTQTGERLDDEHAPDPLLGSWLVEQRGVVFAGDPEHEPPADLAPMLEALLERQGARALLAVRSHDELLGLVVIPASTRYLRGPALAFLDRTAERLAEALVHARMAARAASRAVLAREVELALAVQAELLPPRGPRVLGALTVIGSWRPATSCAGDFWGVYPLGEGRVLLAIGDVTGHGVASAMVTAAAVGACDAAARRAGAALDLRDLISALDTAVRRVGGGELAMTCWASVVDQPASKLTYVSCGHTSPYLCRPADPSSARPDGIELHALVGRGNLLGTGVPAVPRLQERALQPGDLVVCYTDGVVDAQDPSGKAFGDRRLQQLLRRLERRRLTPVAVHDLVQATINGHRAGQPLADDETVVVAQLALPAVELHA